MMFLVGSVSAVGFFWLAVLCHVTKQRTYRDLWSATFGPSTAWLPAVCCLLVTVCSVVAYSMILADTIPALFQAIMGTTLSRTTALLGVTTVLLPLCLMRELRHLAPFSMVGTIGMVYTSLAMLYRYLTGAYTSPQGVFASTLTNSLEASSSSSWFGTTCFQPKNAAILMSMLSTAFMAHYNAPRLYWELQKTSLRRFATVVQVSYAGAMLLMATIAVTGFLTFGTHCQAVILRNYAVSDPLMLASRVAVAVSLLCGYPLAFVGVRQGVLDLCRVPLDRQQTDVQLSNVVSIVLLLVITGLALVLRDIGILLAFGGATWGNAVIYLFPAIMILQQARTAVSSSRSSRTRGKNYDDERNNQRLLQQLVPAALATGMIGIGLGVVGTVRAIAKIRHGT